ncbi:hypothetical protein K8Z61_18515 [Nocardioides sp. TRM66260-LWL]|uniref:hypothetical protein n=1 Tax=Nocardioides sp. TRM66260-LWL TaxID=2874478 RepID=UPI001CC817F1|nr:hypothetical protein [Nocardioides sp. TRM66260-LWL]MBZ5736489.1 hypothetical protein [Nocardioides sp. TRM66260-LWL]
MGYVVKPGQDVWVRFPGDRAVRLHGGDTVPEGLPEAQYERLDRAGLIELASTVTEAEKPKPRRSRTKDTASEE